MRGGILALLLRVAGSLHIAACINLHVQICEPTQDSDQSVECRPSCCGWGNWFGDWSVCNFSAFQRFQRLLHAYKCCREPIYSCGGMLYLGYVCKNESIGLPSCLWPCTPFLKNVLRIMTRDVSSENKPLHVLSHLSP